MNEGNKIVEKVTHGLAALLFLTSAKLQAQETLKGITISVRNGKTGDALKDARLLVFFGKSSQDASSHKASADLHTNSSGDATLPLSNTQLVYLQVFVDFHTLCQDYPNLRAFAVDDIVKEGVSSPNHCGKISVPNAPGMLIIYARPPTLKERKDW